jgi:hypothetical protein
MDEMPEIEAKRDRPFLRSLLKTEMLITLPTLVISIALAYFSFVQADASRKMQRTETWPYVSYGTDNSSPEVKDEISFSLSNDGVGPARLQEMEFIYAGKPMRDPLEFVASCCAAAANAVAKNLTYTTDRVDGVLRPGEKRSFIKLAKTDENVPLWNRLNDERWKVVVRTCYCSIFDDCWVFDSSKGQPDEVKVCPANWTKFGEHPNLRPTAAAMAKAKESLAP